MPSHRTLWRTMSRRLKPKELLRLRTPSRMPQRMRTRLKRRSMTRPMTLTTPTPRAPMTSPWLRPTETTRSLLKSARRCPETLRRHVRIRRMPGTISQRPTQKRCWPRRNSSALKLILEACAQGARYAGMHHMVRHRRRLILQTRHVVVLDVIPFHVCDVEDIECSQPMFARSETDLGIYGRIRRGSGAVVLHQRRLAKMPGAQRAEPPGIALRRQTGVDDIGGAVGNMAANDGDRLRAGVRKCGGSAT